MVLIGGAFRYPMRLQALPRSRRPCSFFPNADGRFSFDVEVLMMACLTVPPVRLAS